MALTTKFSGILGIPLLAVSLFFRAILSEPWPIGQWIAQTRLQRLIGALGIFLAAIFAGFCVIWLGYRFAVFARADSFGEIRFHRIHKILAENESIAQHNWPVDVPQPVLQAWVDHWQPGPVVRAVRWTNHHALLPQAWLIGFLDIYGQSQARPAYLLGEIRTGGWWYYFPLAMLFKTPLATLGAILLAKIVLVIHAKTSGTGAATAKCWPLFAAGFFPIFYLAVAMRSHLDLGIRYILPVYPFLFLIVGIAAPSAHRRWPRAAGAIIVLFILGLSTETFAAFPDYIPFFNAAAGGQRGGLHLLGDSNLDWGQDLPALADWQKQNPNRPVYLCYFGFADPRYYQIKYTPTPGSYAPPALSGSGAGAPVLAISATALQGTYLKPAQRALYEPFRQMKPLAVLGGSIYIFEIPPGLIGRFSP